MPFWQNKISRIAIDFDKTLVKDTNMFITKKDNMRKLTFLSVISFLFTATVALGQVEVGETYSLKKLSQEGVNITRTPMPYLPREAGDTTFTVYQDASVELETYFVNGEQYDNIFNPNPTGIYINKQHFSYFCGLEKSIKQYFSNILEMYEFSFLGSNYLLIINFREDCLGDGCRYRCYNVFDLSGPRVRQISFSSLFSGADTFGDFNSDGILDFVRVAPKSSKDHKPGELVTNYLLTAYSAKSGKAIQLVNKEKSAYYLYVKGDEMAESFQVLQADWFFEVKDTSGNVATKKSYFAPYISFDPMYRYLYSPEGIRIEKNRWSVFVEEVKDLEAAQDYCRKLANKDFKETYIMIDQYSAIIKYQVLYGNFVSRDRALKMGNILHEKGYKPKNIVDFRNGY